MHELAVTQSIVDLVRQHAGDAKVTSVRLRIGRLSGVTPQAVQFCFELVTAGTTLQDAELVIDEQPGLGHCGGCDADFSLADLVLLCPCGSADVDMVSGRELTVVSMEVV
jgi:hydrogenase nickel incorporation protein HypA/HybF